MVPPVTNDGSIGSHQGTLTKSLIYYANLLISVIHGGTKHGKIISYIGHYCMTLTLT